MITGFVINSSKRDVYAILLHLLFFTWLWNIFQINLFLAHMLKKLNMQIFFQKYSAILILCRKI